MWCLLKKRLARKYNILGYVWDFLILAASWKFTSIKKICKKKIYTYFDYLEIEDGMKIDSPATKKKLIY